MLHRLRGKVWDGDSEDESDEHPDGDTVLSSLRAVWQAPPESEGNGQQTPAKKEAGQTEATGKLSAGVRQTPPSTEGALPTGGAEHKEPPSEASASPDASDQQLSADKKPEELEQAAFATPKTASFKLEAETGDEDKFFKAMRRASAESIHLWEPLGEKARERAAQAAGATPDPFKSPLEAQIEETLPLSETQLNDAETLRLGGSPAAAKPGAGCSAAGSWEAPSEAQTPSPAKPEADRADDEEKVDPQLGAQADSPAKPQADHAEDEEKVHPQLGAQADSPAKPEADHAEDEEKGDPQPGTQAEGMLPTPDRVERLDDQPSTDKPGNDVAKADDAQDHAASANGSPKRPLEDASDSEEREAKRAKDTATQLKAKWKFHADQLLAQNNGEYFLVKRSFQQMLVWVRGLIREKTETADKEGVAWVELQKRQLKGKATDAVIDVCLKLRGGGSSFQVLSSRATDANHIYWLSMGIAAIAKVVADLNFSDLQDNSRALLLPLLSDVANLGALSDAAGLGVASGEES